MWNAFKKLVSILSLVGLLLVLIACGGNQDPQSVVEDFLDSGDYKHCTAEVDRTAADQVLQRVQEVGGYIVAETALSPLSDEDGTILEILFLVYAAKDSNLWDLEGEAGLITVSKDGNRNKYHISNVESRVDQDEIESVEP